MNKKKLENKYYIINNEMKRLIHANADLIDEYHETFFIFHRKRKYISELYSRNEQLIKLKFRKLYKIQKKLKYTI